LNVFLGPGIPYEIFFFSTLLSPWKFLFGRFGSKAKVLYPLLLMLFSPSGRSLFGLYVVLGRLQTLRCRGPETLKVLFFSYGASFVFSSPCSRQLLF